MTQCKKRRIGKLALSEPMWFLRRRLNDDSLIGLVAILRRKWKKHWYFQLLGSKQLPRLSQLSLLCHLILFFPKAVFIKEYRLFVTCCVDNGLLNRPRCLLLLLVSPEWSPSSAPSLCMDTQPAMDKKAMAKAPPLPSKNGSEGTLKGEEGGNGWRLAPPFLELGGFNWMLLPSDNSFVFV